MDAQHRTTEELRDIKTHDDGQARHAETGQAAAQQFDVRHLTEAATAGATVSVAWTGVCFLHTQVSRKLGDALDRHGLLDLPNYQVLTALSGSGGRLRIRDLLDYVLLTQSGLSRRVERLELEGLVSREPDPQDRRLVVVRLTSSGGEAVRAASRIHASVIEQYIGVHLSETETATLSQIFGRFLRPARAQRGSAGLPPAPLGLLPTQGTLTQESA